MIRKLTADWVPYSTWTERGSLRHCLINPDIAQLPPSLPSKSVNSSSSLVSRRQLMKYSVAGAVAYGSMAYRPQTCDAGFFSLFGNIAQGILIPALKWCLREVVYYVADAAAKYAANRIIEYIGLSDDQFASRLKSSPNPVLQASGPEARVHAKFDCGVEFPNDGEFKLVVPTTPHKEFAGTSVGLDRVQWDINTNTLEKNAMKTRDIAFVPLSFRRSAFPDNLRTNFRLANELYLSKNEGDQPFTADEVLYTIPVRGKKNKQYTGFCVKRGVKVEFLFV